MLDLFSVFFGIVFVFIIVMFVVMAFSAKKFFADREHFKKDPVGYMNENYNMEGMKQLRREFAVPVQVVDANGAPMQSQIHAQQMHDAAAQQHQQIHMQNVFQHQQMHDAHTMHHTPPPPY